MTIAPTDRDVVHREGTSRLYRFRGPDLSNPTPASDPPKRKPRAEHLKDVSAEAGLPLLLVPSMINRWYVLDLEPGSSVVEVLVKAGLDTYCLDWGAPEDEDRDLEWDQVLARLARAVRVVKRRTGAERIGLLGYCMGATLAGIHAAMHSEEIAALVNLAGPFDFSEGGALKVMTDPRWFDPEAISSAGNMSPGMMQAGFLGLRPTGTVSKWVSFAEKGWDPAVRRSFFALESWASDNVSFPAAAYRTYVEELYQRNALAQGKHWVRGERVDLGAIRCPILTVVAEKDTICPPPAALALAKLSNAAEKAELRVPGGHVGAVVGSRARAALYPALARWLTERLAA
jgi:polyhydroxyalkanoate synthase